MPTRSIVLTDAAEGVWSETFELRESAGLRLAGGSDWSVRKRTLRGGVSEGVDVVDLHNGALSVSILPTRGMGLWRGSYRGIPIGWNSPVKQPVNPCYVNQTDRNGLGWLTGFNELLCRCGLSSNGAPGLDVIVDNTGQKTEAPLTLHGKIANIPAHSRRGRGQHGGERPAFRQRHCGRDDAVRPVPATKDDLRDGPRFESADDPR